MSGMPREERRALQSLYCASASYNQQFETYDEELDLAQFSDWLRALGGRHIARWRARARRTRMRTRGRARARRSMTMTATTAMTAGESNVAQRLYSVLCVCVCARGVPRLTRDPLSALRVSRAARLRGAPARCLVSVTSAVGVTRDRSTVPLLPRRGPRGQTAWRLKCNCKKSNRRTILTIVLYLSRRQHLDPGYCNNRRTSPEI